jgi:hypothetical protein
MAYNMSLCKTSGCTFFGSCTTKGLCSTCFSNTQSTPIDTLLPQDPPVLVLSEPPPNKSRCWKCKKKVGLLGFDCACHHTFCGQCRHAEQHSCTYDYFLKSKDKLSHDNPKIIAPKLTRMD